MKAHYLKRVYRLRLSADKLGFWLDVYFNAIPSKAHYKSLSSGSRKNLYNSKKDRWSDVRLYPYQSLMSRSKTISVRLKIKQNRSLRYLFVLSILPFARTVAYRYVLSTLKFVCRPSTLEFIRTEVNSNESR